MKDDDKFYGLIGDINLYQSSVRRLQDKGWLNDELINAYLHILSLSQPPKRVKALLSYVYSYAMHKDGSSYDFPAAQRFGNVCIECKYALPFLIF